MLYGGRWNSPGKRVIYAAETYSGALLEVLVHRNGLRPPKHHQVVRILIPDDVSTETVALGGVPGWDDEDNRALRLFGDAWIDQKRTLLLRVPSVVAEGRDYNLVINVEHPEFRKLQPEPPVPVRWDPRLMSGRQ